MELSKAKSLAKLEERRKNPPRRIDNSSLPAGYPMYYYCISCGHISDTLPEGHFGSPKRLCDFCVGLKEMGWLE